MVSRSPLQVESLEDRSLMDGSGLNIVLFPPEPQPDPPIPLSADAGGPYGVNVGSTLTLDGSGTTSEPDLTLTYDWDINGDGHFGDAVGVTPTLSWSELVALGMDASSTSSVRLLVNSSSGESSLSFASLQVYPAAPGVPDASFGFDGTVETGVNGIAAESRSVVVTQPDGKLLVAGVKNYQLVLERYNIDGSLDTTITTSSAAGNQIFGITSSVQDLVVQSDGKILIAMSQSLLGDSSSLVLFRLNADGTFDDTFHREQVDFLEGVPSPLIGEYDFLGGGGIGGSGSVITFPGGIGITIMGVANSVSATELHLGADDTIWLVGNRGTDLLVMKMDKDGHRDLSFGGLGAVVTAGGQFTSGVGGITVDAAGRPIVAFRRSGGEIALARYRPDGTMDRSFGPTGIIAVGQSEWYFEIRKLRIDADGSLLVAGRANAVGQGQFFLARLSADGTPDESFGNGGFAFVDFGSDAAVNDLLLLDDGSFLLAGSVKVGTEYRLAAARLDQDGNLDLGFGADGLFVSAGINQLGRSLLMHGERPLLVGQEVLPNGTVGNFTLTRLLGAPPSSNPPIVLPADPLEVQEGGEVVVAISALDSASTPEEIVFLLDGSPRHGILLRDGHGVYSFTQAEVNAGRITYRHDGSETTSDRFILSVRGHEGGWSPAGIGAVVVQPVNDIPVANAGGTYHVPAGGVLQLDASGSYDVDSAIVSYEWDLDGDGQFDDASGVSPVIPWSTIWSLIATSGQATFTVSLRAQDEQGANRIGTAEIVVAPPPVGETVFLASDAISTSSSERFHLLPNGNVYVLRPKPMSSYYYDGWELARLRPDGTLDTTFSGGSVPVLDAFGNGYHERTLFVLDDGSIIVTNLFSGWYDGTGYLYRYLPDGSRDLNFGTEGVLEVSTNFEPIRLFGDGLGGLLIASERITRVSASGQIDTSFNETGSVVNPKSEVEGYTLVADAQGRIVIATYGDVYGMVQLHRYSANGQIDASFGNDGMVNVELGTNIEFNGLFLGPNEEVLFGRKHRLSGELSFDRFDDAGNIAATVTLESASAVIQGQVLPISTRLLPNGQWIVTARITQPDVASFLIGIRYGSDGTLDRSFASQGYAKLPLDLWYFDSIAVAGMPGEPVHFLVRDYNQIFHLIAMDEPSTIQFPMEVENSPPQEHSSGTVTLVEGGTVTLTAADLEFLDAEHGPEHVIYRLAVSADYGPWHYFDSQSHVRILVDGVRANEFTQEQVNQGRVSIWHDGSENSTDVIRLVVRDELGASFGPFGLLVSVIPVNDAPIAVGVGTYEIDAGRSLVLSAYESMDVDSTGLIFSWDVDGNGIFGDALGKQVVLTWSQLVAFGIDQPGTYQTIRVQVTDPEGLVSTSSAATVIVHPIDEGSLDPTFGVDGVRRHELIGLTENTSLQVFTDPYSRAYVLARKFDSTGSIDYSLGRYSPDGLLDTNFATDGWTSINFFADYSLSQVKFTADGKILLVGSALIGGEGKFTLARLNGDGSLDASFGLGGKTIVDISPTSATGLDVGMVDAVELPDGRWVIGGTTTDRYLVLRRLQVDGQLDATFAPSPTTVNRRLAALERLPNGQLAVKVRYSVDDYQQVVFHSDGTRDSSVPPTWAGTPSSIRLATGQEITLGADRYRFSIHKINLDGSWPAEFGPGEVRFPASSSYTDALAVQADGKILVAGTSFGRADYPYAGEEYSDFAVVRYHADGSVDTGFGVGGMQRVQVGPGHHQLLSMSIDWEGRIVLVGKHDGDLVFTRLMGYMRLLGVQAQPMPPNPADPAALPGSGQVPQSPAPSSVSYGASSSFMQFLGIGQTIDGRLALEWMEGGAPSATFVSLGNSSEQGLGSADASDEERGRDESIEQGNADSAFERSARLERWRTDPAVEGESIQHSEETPVPFEGSQPLPSSDEKGVDFDLDRQLELEDEAPLFGLPLEGQDVDHIFTRLSGSGGAFALSELETDSSEGMSFESATILAMVAVPVAGRQSRRSRSPDLRSQKG